MTRILLKTALIASGAALLIAAGPKADLNQDGQVTKAEFTQAAQAKFTATDINNDGLLSQDERKAYKAAERKNREDARFAKLDANGDGLLSRDEIDAKSEERKAKMTERRQEFMNKYDTNLDGELSDAERTVMDAERDAKRAEKKAERGERGERKGKRGKRAEVDADGDGFVSLAEHMAVSEQLFTRMDANGDGVLTKGEGKKRKGKRGGKRGK